MPVISVVSSTKNVLVAVLEDVTQYAHCSKHLKCSKENIKIQNMNIAQQELKVASKRRYSKTLD